MILFGNIRNHQARICKFYNNGAKSFTFFNFIIKDIYLIMI